MIRLVREVAALVTVTAFFAMILAWAEIAAAYTGSGQ